MPNVVLTPQPLTYEESHDPLFEKIGKDITFAQDLISKCYGIPVNHYIRWNSV
jgi:disease resistance protein RPS2